MLRKALFLDRDGTLILDEGYLADPTRVRLIPGVADVLRTAQADGYFLVVVTNQSGIGRGLFGAQDYRAVNAAMWRLLWREQVFLHGAYMCPHTPDAACLCRKPAPKLVLDACAALEVDPAQSWIVGDKQSDVDVALGVPGLRAHRTLKNQPWLLPYHPTPVKPSTGL